MNGIFQDGSDADHNSHCLIIPLPTILPCLNAMRQRSTCSATCSMNQRMTS